ncbi:MAG: MerR family transcriptional regulator [Erysipelotrichaceae bacterium]|nr:MerR family transcriptional regulator [Erysipelotrichaceae bacterium]
MSYSIKEVADMMGVGTPTLRYYDEMGLLPGIKRVNGRRVFEDKDFKWLRVLNCMKNMNMPIKKIKEYVDLALQGDSTLQARYDLIKEQKENLQAQIDTLNICMKEIEYKEWYYETAIKAGTEKVVENVPSEEATLDIDTIPKEFKKEG